MVGVEVRIDDLGDTRDVCDRRREIRSSTMSSAERSRRSTLPRSSMADSSRATPSIAVVAMMLSISRLWPVTADRIRQCGWRSAGCRSRSSVGSQRSGRSKSTRKSVG